MQKISKLTDIVRDSTSPSALQTAILHINSAITVAEGLQKSDTEHSYDLKPKHKFASNKNFEVQERFHKAKKQQKSQRRF